MGIVASVFGTNSDKKEVTKYTMENRNGVKASVIDLGAVVTNLFIPDRNGTFDDVVLGYDDVAAYEKNGPSFGAPIGRYANRISDAKFTLNGREYKLERNDASNCLHSGFLRYAGLMYEGIACEQGDGEDRISLTRLSPDGEQGFPGSLSLTITYTLNDNDEFIIEYFAVCDEDTVINLTNHSYFNLGSGGHACPSVLDHEVSIEADLYTPANDVLVPTGEFKEVAGSALDFRQPKKIGENIGLKDAYGNEIKGFDHNFVLRSPRDVNVRKAASFYNAKTGRLMEVFTDQPGLQLYTANTLDEPNGKGGVRYGNFCGACFETQNFPNAVNTKGFPSAILRAGDEFESMTVYKFKTV